MVFIFLVWYLQELSVHSKFERVLGQLQSRKMAAKGDANGKTEGHRPPGHLRSSV